MKTVKVSNVNQALSNGIGMMLTQGIEIPSRTGMTLEIPTPVTTVYEKPWERVLINPTRDANPFFHFMESLWILVGRNDVDFLTEFNKNMASFSDNGVTFNAPYGYRLRNYFKDSANYKTDQIEDVISILKNEPNSRQAVMQIWDTQDIDKPTLDKACNMSVVFRIRSGRLDMTVYNRSNDMLWGAYGANAVQFSMLQEYVAARLDIPMGTYYQVSNSFHVYTSGMGGKLWDKLITTPIEYEDPYEHFNISSIRMNPREMNSFERDLDLLFDVYDDTGLSNILADLEFESSYFNYITGPMLKVWYTYKQGNKKEALELCKNIIGEDWSLACQMWIQERL